MPLYHEERLYINCIKERLDSGGSVSIEELKDLLEKYEEMLEMNAVTVKIIDKLMFNYDRLKREIVENQP